MYLSGRMLSLDASWNAFPVTSLESPSRQMKFTANPTQFGRHSLSTLSLLFLCLISVSTLGQESSDTPPEGFTPLFNGKDLTNWRGFVDSPPNLPLIAPGDLETRQKRANLKMREHWKAENGILVFDGKGDNLCSEKDFGDFELYVDWKIEPHGDSGIYVRGTPQIQIWDPVDEKVGAQVGSGGLYNNEKNPSKPLVKADNPVGEWNTFYIKMVGEKVTVKLNGKLVVDNVTLENFWDRKKPVAATGPIELQNHGNTLYFRRIYVREIK